MTYVVYHITSTVKIKEFNTETGAKRSTTCMNRNAKKADYVLLAADYNPYAYTDVENYNKNIVTTKKVVNLMSGKEIEIPSNTPHCCDPSTETYWSM